MPGPLTSWFAEDHARLDGLLRRCVTDPATFDRRAFEDFRGGLLRHIALEEKFLLPAMRAGCTEWTNPHAGLQAAR